MGASTTWMFPFCFSVSSFAIQSPRPKCSLSVWIYLHYIWQSCYNSSRGGIQVRVAVVEDELLSRKKILSYLEMFEKESGIPIQVETLTDGTEIVEKYNTGKKYDVILLDIEMEHMDGMKAAEWIRNLDEEVILIFITNMAQFVMKGYEVSALDFLVKPVSYYMFVEKMHKAYDRISMREERSIIIKGKECIYKVHTTELIYIEVQNHSLTFHTMQGNYMCTGSLKKVEKDLEGLPFARCSSSYLLNLMHVLRIEKEHVIMDNKDELLLSRLKRQEFMEILTDYYGGVQ